MTLIVVAALVVVVVSLVSAVAFRFGRLRGLARWHGDERAPTVVRNLPFVAIPLATYGLLTLGVVVAVTSGQPWPVPVLYGSVVVAALVLFASVWIAARPPDAIKPPWLRRAEEHPDPRRAGGADPA